MTFGESAPLSGQNDGPFSRRRNTGWASANMLTQQQRRRGNSVAFLIPHRRSLRRHGLPQRCSDRRCLLSGPSRHFAATQQLGPLGAKRTLSGSRCAPNL